jgi:hypothetical protein
VTVVGEGEPAAASFCCEDHTPAILGLSGAAADAASRVLETVRRVIAFANEHIRMPNEAESATLGVVGAVATEDPESNFASQLNYLTRLADFIEKKGRLPDDSEMPDDPF